MLAMVAFIGVVLASSYLVLVSFCVCHRMSADTSHTIRALVLSLGGTGIWSLSRAFEMAGRMTLQDVMFCIAVIGCALFVAFMPRFPTGEKHAVESAEISS